MSNFNGAPYLDRALVSVLAQSFKAIELLVVDDASTDDSVAILRKMAGTDPRLKPIFLKENRGPAGARNAALNAAQGDWIAIVDADDLIHPERFDRLLMTAEETGADMIADDLVSFGARETAGQTLLSPHSIHAPTQITLAAFLRSDTASAGMTSFGYLKPLIRRSRLGPLRYNETLRIGEDFDLYARLLLQGAQLLVCPQPTYLYRRHTGSVSHRLSVPTLKNLVEAHHAMLGAIGDDAGLRAAASLRGHRLNRALNYQRFVNAVKARRVLRAAGHIFRRPGLMMDVLASLVDRRRRVMTDAETFDPQTIVLAAPSDLAAVQAPPEALRIPVRASHAGSELASRLAMLASARPIDVIAFGLRGLDGLGYVPAWRSARLSLGPNDARSVALPPGVALQVLPND